MEEDGRAGRWLANARAMRQRIRARFSSPGFLKQSHSRASWRTATATSLVVARVFKGNVVFSRMARGLSTQQWHQRVASLRCIVSAKSQLSLPPSSLPLQQSVRANSDQVLAPAITTPEDSRIIRMVQAVALPIIGNICHAFMHGLNRTEVIGAEKIQRAVLDRPRGQALITVSNHVASMDDPLVIASMLSPHMMMKASKMRWTLCATDRCFTNAASTAFFRGVKVLPLARGGGVHQLGLDLALSKLRQGDWVHIFPEGSRSRDEGKTIGQIKRGIGRLVMDLENAPLVVPFVHSGMQEVMPIGSKLPLIRKQVTVLVGDPIDLDDLLKNKENEGILYDAVALRVSEKLQELKRDLDRLVLDGKQSQEVQVFERRGGLWESVDWDNHGPLKDLTVLEDKASSMGTYSHSLGASESLPGANSIVGIRGDSTNEVKARNHETGIFSDAQNAMGVIAQQGGMLRRLQAFVDPTTFVGFAARGLFQSRQPKQQMQ